MKIYKKGAQIYLRNKNEYKGKKIYSVIMFMFRGNGYLFYSSTFKSDFLCADAGSFFIDEHTDW